jgi:hypothetical protein
MAQFPKSKEEKKLSDLEVGESCYTAPWAMWVRTDGSCFLNENYPAYNAPKGTAQLKITRVKDGYIAFIYDVDYRWSKSDSHGFCSPDEVCHGPVVAFGVTSYEQLSVEELEVELQKAVEDENYELASKIRNLIVGRASA